MTHINRSERGQALILIMIGMIALIGMTGLTIDGGDAYSEKRNSQNAADTAVLAAALAKVRDQDWQAIAYERASSNGYDDNGTTNRVEIYSCTDPASACEYYAGNSEYIQVVITAHTKAYFAPIVGIQELTTRSSAVARAVPTTTAQMFDGHAVVGLAPHDCQAVKYQGTADTSIPYGGIFVNSDCANSAFFNHSGAAQLSTPSLCSVGGITYAPGALDIPSISTGCTPYAYPPADIVEPDPVCTGNATQSGSTMSPGNYTGTFPPHGVTLLQSGVYCINGDFQLNGGDQLTGYNVVIRVNGGDVNWNGGAQVNLTAPTNGPFEGLLLLLPSDPTNAPDATVTINGNSNSSLTGSILAMSAAISVEGTGDDGIFGQVIGYTVELTGNSANSIIYNDSQNFDAETSPSIELTQ
jgi:Flp pilus assembly protein TadG